MRGQRQQVRRATAAKVCLDPAKSARFSVPVLPTAGFDRPFYALSMICGCPSWSNERCWPPNYRESGESRLKDVTSFPLSTNRFYNLILLGPKIRLQKAANRFLVWFVPALFFTECNAILVDIGLSYGAVCLHLADAFARVDSLAVDGIGSFGHFRRCMAALHRPNRTC